ncbi:MAG: class I SAM-dependent methyltransferase [Oligoflexales bacterium]|nr:class I SAM-dependent methyltransferase [Oligoflexales bacterium]
MTSIDTSISRGITASVELQYNLFPYPSYPLLGKPFWQDSYSASSLFAGCLLKGVSGIVPSLFARDDSVKSAQSCPRVLIAGCGEMLPLVIRQLEPSSHQVFALDLSLANLKRAQLRMRNSSSSVVFIHDDLENFAKKSPIHFDHIDAYGVLHHLASPSDVLAPLTRRLKEGGTMRVMVYNSQARSWLWSLRKSLRILGLSFEKKKDLKSAKRWIFCLRKFSPILDKKFRQASPSDTFFEDAIFVDTFFHARELRQSFQKWWDVFLSSGLIPFGLFDRYGELDACQNPLWCIPSVEDIHRRSLTEDYQNNLEVFLYKPRRRKSVSIDHSNRQRSVRQWGSVGFLQARRPPALWFSFDETKNLSWLQRRKIWFNFSSYLYQYGAWEGLSWDGIPYRALQRLARLGAILPGMMNNEREDLLKSPMIDSDDHEGRMDDSPEKNFEGVPGTLLDLKNVLANVPVSLSDRKRDLLSKILQKAGFFS